MFRNIYIVTEIGKEYGRGHFSRMSILAHAILLLNRYNVFFVSLNDNTSFYGFNYKKYDDLLSDTPLLTIIDKRETNVEIVEKIKKVSAIIIVDSVGLERELADIVIEMIPSLETKTSDLINIKPYSLTILNTKNIKPKYDINAPILIYLGSINEIKKSVVEVLKKIKNKNFVLIDDNESYACENIKIKKFSNEIFNESYSSVITYYGLMSFECASFNIPVFLIGITDYHKKLSIETNNIFHFVDDINNLESALNSKKKKESINIDTDKSIERFINIIENIETLKNKNCPICNSNNFHLALRDEKSNLYRCNNCHTLYRLYFLSTDSDFYDSEYFEEDYKLQYGKTYVEDSDNLRALARNRLHIIKRHKPSGKILDLGSAMGFFLKEASLMGYEPLGVEISEYAVNYSKNELSLEVHNISVLDFDYKENEYHVITAWYVLEHIAELKSVIKKIASALKKNGVFAFAMPHSYGVTGRFSPDNYNKIMPKDHAFEFSVYSIDLLLKEYGFTKVHIENKGIYFERFLNIFNINNKAMNNPLFNFIYKKLAKILNLGDTFECYYIKK